MTTPAIKAQTIALAGALQSVYLVDQVARTGAAPAESVNPSLNSLFEFNAASAELTYGGLHGVRLGLQVLGDVFDNYNQAQYRTIIRYTLGLLFLQKKLSANPELLAIMRNRLEHTALKAEHFSDDVSSVSASLASIYQDTVSTFKFRIQVVGSMQQLQSSQNADTIRALLLAGIRSAVMWRQTGGKRWHLLVKRKQLQNTARKLLTQL